MADSEVSGSKHHNKKKAKSRVRRDAPSSSSLSSSDLSFDRAMASLKPLSARVANEDLYDLFLDYFENGRTRVNGFNRRRRRRSGEATLFV